MTWREACLSGEVQPWKMQRGRVAQLTWHSSPQSERGPRSGRDCRSRGCQELVLLQPQLGKWRPGRRWVHERRVGARTRGLCSGGPRTAGLGPQLELLPARGLPLGQAGLREDAGGGRCPVAVEGPAPGPSDLPPCVAWPCCKTPCAPKRGQRPQPGSVTSPPTPPPRWIWDLAKTLTRKVSMF